VNKVAIKSYGVVQVHARGRGEYAALCGLAADSVADDGDDRDGREVPVPKGAKIDCDQCLSMWSHWRAFKRADFV